MLKGPTVLPGFLARPRLTINRRYLRAHAQSAQRSTNDEYEEEARLKKKKEEDQITVYLGQGSSELTKTEPWYHDGQQAAKTDVTAKDDRTKYAARSHSGLRLPCRLHACAAGFAGSGASTRNS